MVSSTEIAPNQGVLHRVGEVIRDQLEITEVLQQGGGKGSYLCKRLSDNAKLLVECVFSSHTISPMEYIQRKNELLAIRDIEDPWIQASFELPVQDGVRFYVVKIVVEPSRSDDGEHRLEDSETSMTPEPRPPPDGCEGIVVFRRGPCHLEIDIPSSGSIATAIVLLAMAFPISVGLTSFFIYLLVAGSSPVGAVAAYLILQLSVVAPCSSIANHAFEHVNLVVTPKYYVYQSALELTPKSGTTANHQNAAEPQMTAMGNCRRFCLVGNTAYLREAKMSVYKDHKGFEHQRFVLVDVSGHERELDLNVFPHQEEWLVSEINEVLHNITLRAIGV